MFNGIGTESSVLKLDVITDDFASKQMHECLVFSGIEKIKLNSVMESPVL